MPQLNSMQDSSITLNRSYSDDLSDRDVRQLYENNSFEYNGHVIVSESTSVRCLDCDMEERLPSIVINSDNATVSAVWYLTLYIPFRNVECPEAWDDSVDIRQFHDGGSPSHPNQIPPGALHKMQKRFDQHSKTF